MSLTLAQMKAVLHEIEPLLVCATLDFCLAATDKKFILHFKNAPALLLCFQEPFLRFHLTQHAWKEHPHPLSKQLTQALHAWRLIRCELMHEDRVLVLEFKKGDNVKQLICEFIPKKVNCYLIDCQQQIMASLNPISQQVYLSPAKVSNQLKAESTVFSSTEIENIYTPLELEAEFIKKKHQVEMQLKNQLKQIQKSKMRISENLDLANRWEEVQHEAMLLQANLYNIKKGMAKVAVQDWLKDNAEVEILLDTHLTPSDEVAKRFQKSKKLKRGIKPLQHQLEVINKNAEKNGSLLTQLQTINSKKELDHFCRKNALVKLKTLHQKPLPALPYREFVTHAGLKIWVGKSAKDNDKLTFTYANGSDYWLHARDVPGSHVVIHLGKQNEPDDESLKDAMQAALFYSKVKGNQAGEVCITQCKYVSRYGKNQPGKVQISKHRVVYTKMDLDRLKKLKERK